MRVITQEWERRRYPGPGERPWHTQIVYREACKAWAAGSGWTVDVVLDRGDDEVTESFADVPWLTWWIASALWGLGWPSLDLRYRIWPRLVRWWLQERWFGLRWRVRNARLWLRGRKGWG